jgi:hypothetical protein
MSRFSLSEYFTAVTRAPYSKVPADFLRPRGVNIEPEALIERMERNYLVLTPSPSVTAKPALQRPEELLEADREALDIRWQAELHAWIAQRRVKTSEFEAAAVAARQATEEVVKRIESRPATTAPARALRAQASRWRRYGASFEGQGDV